MGMKHAFMLLSLGLGVYGFLTTIEWMSRATAVMASL
jgi:hypothetical protein